MELPDKDFTRLSSDAPAGHWAVHHLVTGEVRPVPAHMCDPELSYDDEGSGYVHTADTSEGAIWLADLMHWQAVKDDEGEFYIVKAGVFSKWEEAFEQHVVCKPSLEAGPFRFSCQVYVFTVVQVGLLHCFWSIPDLVAALDIASYKKCRSAYIHRNWPSWVKHCASWGLKHAHLRLASLTGHRTSAEDKDTSVVPPRLWRVLPQQTVSTLFLLLLCLRLGTPQQAHRNMQDCSAWLSCLQALLLLASAGQAWVLHVGVPRSSSEGPAAYKEIHVMADGTVDVAPLAGMAWPPGMAHIARTAFGQFKANPQLKDLLLSIFKLAPLRPWFISLLTAIADVIEQRFLDKPSCTDEPMCDAAVVGMQLEPATAEGRQRQRRYHKIVKSLAGMLDMSIRQKILRYYFAARKALNTEDVHITVDASRIGRRNCLLTCFGSEDVVALGPPQVQCLSLIMCALLRRSLPITP